jgi:hypothetical protein
VVDQNLRFERNTQLKIVTVINNPNVKPGLIQGRDIGNSNLFSKVRALSLRNDIEASQERAVANTHFIDNIDLNRSNIYYDIEIDRKSRASRITLAIDATDSVGFTNQIDSILVDQQEAVGKYDIQSHDYAIRVGYASNDNAIVDVVTKDPLIGGFNLYYKNEASFSTMRNQYVKIGSAPVVDGAATFSFNNSYFRTSIAAQPISRITDTPAANVMSLTLDTGFTNDLAVGFYVGNYADDEVSFNFTKLDTRIRKIILYRSFFGLTERKLVDTISVGTNNQVIITDRDRPIQYNMLYTFDYIDDMGVERQSPTQVYVPALKINSLASIRASLSGSDAVVTGSNLNFNVTVDYNTESPYDQAVADLKSLGLDNLLDADLKKMTNNLKPLVRVLASRINVYTGQEEDLGVYPPGMITLSKSDNSIYRFEMAIRSTPELLENLAAGQNILAKLARGSGDIVDTSSKLLGTQAKFNQTSYTAKFLNKSAIRDSMLKYGKAADGIDLGYYAGRTGIFSDVSVNVSPPSVNITEASYTRVGKSCIITWRWESTLTPVEFEIVGPQAKYNAISDNAGEIVRFCLKDAKPGTYTIHPIVMSARQDKGSYTLEIR